MARTGMVYEGRFYETDGQEAIGVHEAPGVRLLSPIERAHTVRIFRFGERLFDYANGNAVFGPNMLLRSPEQTGFRAVGCLAVVIAGAVQRISPLEAEDAVLGYTLATSFRTGDARGGGLDVGIAIGPVLITVDEFDDSSVVTEAGRRLGGSIVIENPPSATRSQLIANVALTATEAISIASYSCALREGDVIAIPVVELQGELSVGDEVRTSHPALGLLATRVVAP